VSPARRVAYTVVRRVFEEGAYADLALHGEAKELDTRDRALAKQLVFGTVQRKGTLDWVVDNLVEQRVEPAVRAALWLGLYQLLFLDGIAPHAAVAESVELAKPSPGHRLVNAVLRRVQREGVELPSDEQPAGAAIRHSHPQWLVEMWWEMLGAAETRLLLAANNEPAETAVRVNTLVVPEGPDGLDLPGRREDDAIVLDAPLDVFASELFETGAITPQSRASQAVARVVEPQPGERVLDLCAAPGGKTTHLAALMRDEGEIVAVERHPGRARALEETCRRMRASIVRVHVGDAKEGVPGAFDRVLVDPPCSGLGTLRSHPDLRWRASPGGIDAMAGEQDAILGAARRALAPGGRLVYSTCTISAREERLRGSWCKQLLPHRDDTDGFYIARDGG
jgi:16S rRNA (cytosine967-C5)-methyltransferase